MTLQSIGAEDGRTWGGSTGSGFVSGSPAGADLRLGDTADVAYRSILSFNGASLPDMALNRVTGAVLTVTRESFSGIDPSTWAGAIEVHIAPGSFNQNHLEEADFEAASPSGPVAIIEGIQNLNIPIMSTAFNPSGLGAVAPRDRIQLRLRHQIPILSNGFAWDYSQFYSGESSIPEYRPELQITYLSMTAVPVELDQFIVD